MEKGEQNIIHCYYIYGRVNKPKNFKTTLLENSEEKPKKCMIACSKLKKNNRANCDKIWTQFLKNY